MNDDKYKDTLKQLKRARYELFLFYEIGNAMRTSLKLEHILYAILTCVTAKEGLGFDRAFLFLVNSEKTKLVGKMAIGPKSGQKPDKIWHQIKQEKKDLSALVESYEELSSELNKGLSSLVKKISIPLNEEAGIPALTALENMLHKVTLSTSAKKVNKEFLDTLQLSDFIALPLRGKNDVHGVLIADNPITKKSIDNDDVRILSLFANQAGLAIDNSKHYENTKKLTELDSLTLLYNHGKFQHLLTNEVKKSLRYKSNLSLLLIDIDFFKQFNDTHGHQAGDEVLRQISSILKTNARVSDMVARYGGEEFAIICVRTKQEDALKLAERIRKAVENHNFSLNNSKEGYRLTITIGISSMPSTITDKNNLIKQADQALYKGKAKGRNRIEIST
ncbi:MAG: sensor domain-containing diguanylate cyclase [Candidatus Kappaea frigidicola]|nr:sensor domain-containing diguanylate cyclase [Candidatus Kappaea frigidicola]